MMKIFFILFLVLFLMSRSADSDEQEVIPLLASGWEVKEDADISLFYGGKKIKVIALEKPFEHKTRKGEIMMYIAKLLYVPSKEIFWIGRHDFSDFVLWKDRIITIANKYITDIFLYTDNLFSINDENDLLSKVEKKYPG